MNTESKTKLEFDRLWGDRAAIEFTPQRTLIIQWWDNAYLTGDWFLCAVLLRGMMSFCPDTMLDDLRLLHQIARDRITVSVSPMPGHPAAIDRFWLSLCVLSCGLGFLWGWML